MSKQFIYPVRVYYEDTDAAGVVYHTNYIKYMERARSEWLLSLGHICGENCGFVVRRIEIDYLKPARLYDQLEVVSEVKEAKNASLIFKQVVRLAGSHNLSCPQLGFQVLAPIDPSSLAFQRGGEERATGVYSTYMRIASDEANKAENQNAKGIIFCEALITVVSVQKDMRPCRFSKDLLEKLTHDA